VRSAEMILGRPPALAMCPGLLEIRFYAERGIPALAFGPGLLSVAHGPHESVRIEDIYNWTAIYALTAVELLGSGD
jgi:succinyl-diaminopimelate desuccinylase